MNNQQLILLLSLDLPTKLSKEQSKQLADEFIFLEKRIAELEQENNMLKRVEKIFNDSPDLTFNVVKKLFKDELAIRDLEQQAKALEELLTYPNHRFHGDSRVYYSEYSINRSIENLRKQAKGGDV